MMAIRKIEEKIEKKREEIASLERQIGEARAYLLALQDTLKLFPKDQASVSGVVLLRPGTEVAKAYDVLKKEGSALHINEILKRMGKEVTKQNKISVAGSVSGYVRRNYVFTRPAPNTFGLVEFNTPEKSIEPPEDFGLSIGSGIKTTS